MITEEKLEKELVTAKERKEQIMKQYEGLQEQMRLAQDNCTRLALDLNAVNEKIKTLEWAKGNPEK